ncbi:unnamed protein product [Somion occarium]|uniref:Uncharacterized protein n=1 Tax=Somion occarium TaxID=3059160 RepID=A0ABP1D8W2_9APHY
MSIYFRKQLQLREPPSSVPCPDQPGEQCFISSEEHHTKHGVHRHTTASSEAETTSLNASLTTVPGEPNPSIAATSSSAMDVPPDSAIPTTTPFDPEASTADQPPFSAQPGPTPPIIASETFTSVLPSSSAPDVVASSSLIPSSTDPLIIIPPPPSTSDTSSSNTDTESSPISSPATATHHSNAAGAIAGGVIGGLAFIALLIAGWFFWRKRKYRRHHLAPSAEFMHHHNRYPSVPGSIHPHSATPPLMRDNSLEGDEPPPAFTKGTFNDPIFEKLSAAAQQREMYTSPYRGNQEINTQSRVLSPAASTSSNPYSRPRTMHPV